MHLFVVSGFFLFSTRFTPIGYDSHHVLFLLMSLKSSVNFFSCYEKPVLIDSDVTTTTVSALLLIGMTCMAG